MPDVVQFRQKQETERGRGGGENQRSDGDEGEGDALRNQVGQHDNNRTRDDDQIDRHPDILAVVEGGYFHMPRLPRHVHADDQQEALVHVEGAQPTLGVLRTTHFHLLGWGC